MEYKNQKINIEVENEGAASERIVCTFTTKQGEQKTSLDKTRGIMNYTTETGKNMLMNVAKQQIDYYDKD